MHTFGSAKLGSGKECVHQMRSNSERIVLESYHHTGPRFPGWKQDEYYTSSRKRGRQQNKEKKLKVHHTAKQADAAAKID